MCIKMTNIKMTIFKFLTDEDVGKRVRGETEV